MLKGLLALPYLLILLLNYSNLNYMKHGNRYYHHSTDLQELPCAICNKPFRMYWKDKEELNGFSDTTYMKDNKKVHYFCIPGAKSLTQLNEERKQLHFKNRK